MNFQGGWSGMGQEKKVSLGFRGREMIEVQYWLTSALGACAEGTEVLPPAPF